MITRIPSVVRCLALTLAGVLWSAGLLAQAPGGSPASVNAALTQLFGKNNTFTAKAAMKVLDQNKDTVASGPMDFAMLNGNVRLDVDISQLQSKQIPAEAVASLKQMGMERIASVFRADKKTTYLLYPSLKVCMDMPLPKEETEVLKNPPKFVTTELGKETLDGIAVVKNRLNYTDPSGQKHEALTWTAPSLKDFPLQIQTAEKGSTLVLRFSDVKLAKPDAGLFDIPAGYEKFADMQAMMAAVMKKMMSAGGK